MLIKYTPAGGLTYKQRDLDLEDECYFDNGAENKLNNSAGTENKLNNSAGAENTLNNCACDSSFGVWLIFHLSI